ncbi:cell division protein FtsZ, partial [Staphylococcus aureus]
ELVVTVIETCFDDKPTSPGRQSGSTGFGTSVHPSSNATSKEKSFTSNSSNAQATDSVSERTHTTTEDDIPSFIRNREERRSRRTRR